MNIDLVARLRGPGVCRMSPGMTGDVFLETAPARRGSWGLTSRD